MADARLTHPNRETLPLRQRQTNTDTKTAAANIANEIGVDRPSLVHTETREREIPVRGVVTGRRLAAQDPNTDDIQQALANYVDTLQAHVDVFQGDGYTYEDDLLGRSLNGILESVSWSLTPGQLGAIEYETEFTVGKGVLEAEPIQRRNPTVDMTRDTLLTIDGTDLPGFREYEVEKTVGTDPKAVFDRDSAENNQVVIDDGDQLTIQFRGTHTGDPATRKTRETRLDELVATEAEVTLQTAFPGYSIDGFLIEHETGEEARFGSQSNHYSITFVEGTKA